MSGAPKGRHARAGAAPSGLRHDGSARSGPRAGALGYSLIAPSGRKRTRPLLRREDQKSRSIPRPAGTYLRRPEVKRSFLDSVLRGAEALAARDPVGTLPDPDLLRRF